MKNKADIIKSFRQCVVTLGEASQEMTRACDYLEQLPKFPSRNQAARLRMMLTALQATNGLLADDIGNSLRDLENLYSEN